MIKAVKRLIVMFACLAVAVLTLTRGRPVCADEFTTVQKGSQDDIAESRNEADLLYAGELSTPADTVLSGAAAPKASVTSKSLYTTSSAYKIKINNAASDAVIKYSSSDKTVAKVTSTGRIYPVAAGKATVTVKVTQGGKSYSSKIKVTVKNPYLKITNSIDELEAGEVCKLTVKGYGVTPGKLKWTSSVKKYATVSTAGKVTAKAEGAGKKVKITAKDTESGLSCSITIKIAEAKAEDTTEATETEEIEAVEVKTAEKAVRDPSFAAYSRLTAMDPPDVAALKSSADASSKTYSAEEKKEYVGNARISGDGIDPAIAELMAKNAEILNGKYSSEASIRSKQQADEYIRSKANSYTMFSMFIADASCLRAPAEYLAMMPSIDSISFSEISVGTNAIDLVVNVERNPSFQESDGRIMDAVYSGDLTLLEKDEKTAYDRIVELAKLAMQYTDLTERAKFLHDTLILQTKYDENESTGGVGHTIAGCMNGHLCVCDGYAKSYFLLCNMCDIPCVCVRGDAGGGHIWNEIFLNGSWYQVDVTWDDPIPDVEGAVRYNYFLVSNDRIAKDHAWDRASAPQAKSDEQNPVYIKYKGRMFETVSEASDYIARCIQAGDKTIEYLLAVEDKGFAMCKEALRNHGYSVQMDGAGPFGYLYSIELR